MKLFFVIKYINNDIYNFNIYIIEMINSFKIA